MFVLRKGRLQSRIVRDVVEASVYLLCSCDQNIARSFKSNCRGASQVINPASLTLSPAVRHLVETHNITDTSTILPSGPKSRLLKGDILRYLDEIRDRPTLLSVTKDKRVVAQSPIVVKHAAFTDIPVGEEQREAAAEVVRSKQEIPHVYFIVDCLVPSWLHEQSEEIIQAHVLKCTALATLEMPEVISTDCRVLSKSDISISFSTLNDTGPSRRRLLLSTETVARMPLGELSQTLAENIIEIRQNTNISVTYHTRDIVRSGRTDILLPGQVMILHVFGRQKDDDFITVNLTADCRVIGLELAAKFLDALKTMCLKTL